MTFRTFGRVTALFQSISTLQPPPIKENKMVLSVAATSWTWRWYSWTQQASSDGPFHCKTLIHTFPKGIVCNHSLVWVLGKKVFWDTRYKIWNENLKWKLIIQKKKLLQSVSKNPKFPNSKSVLLRSSVPPALTPFRRPCSRANKICLFYMSYIRRSVSRRP